MCVLLSGDPFEWIYLDYLKAAPIPQSMVVIWFAFLDPKAKIWSPISDLCPARGIFLVSTADGLILVGFTAILSS